MLGFAVVALFGLAVFSTIVATVNEMPKPNSQGYIYNYHKVHREQEQQKQGKHKTQTSSDSGNMTTMFEVKVPQDIDYEEDDQETRWAPSSLDYDDEPYEEEDRNRPKYEYHREKNYHHHYSGQSPAGLPPPYAYPPFPGPGYVSGGVGQSSASAMRPSDTTNKAFVPFFGYVDPIILIAIVAFPVLCTLGITSLLMPIIPIVIYIIGLIFPSSRKLVKSQVIAGVDANKLTDVGKNVSLSQPSLRALLWIVEKSIDHWQRRSAATVGRKRRRKM